VERWEKGVEGADGNFGIREKREMDRNTSYKGNEGGPWSLLKRRCGRGHD